MEPMMVSLQRHLAHMESRDLGPLLESPCQLDLPRYLQDASSENATSQLPQMSPRWPPGTNDNANGWNSSIFSDAEDTDYELDSSYPRLKSPFYEKLRRKYPQAFRRKNMNSSMSETSSICSEAPMSRPRGYRPITPRGEGHPADLPPRTPRRESHPRESSRMESESDNMGVIGIPRPRARRGFYSKTGSHYSSMGSLCSEAGSRPYGALCKSESMVSIRERLIENQQCWNRLLTDDPVRKLKSRSKVDLSTVGLSLPKNNELSGYGLKSDFNQSKTEKTKARGSNKLPNTEESNSSEAHARLMELEKALEKMASAVNRNETLATLTQPLEIDTSNNSIHTAGLHLPDFSLPSDISIITSPPHPAENIGQFPHKKRFASPDSHDSAVDVDSASSQSNPTADTSHSRIPSDSTPDTSTSNQSLIERVSSQADQQSAETQKVPSQDSSERPSRARSRAPKLRNRGASPLLIRDNTSCNSSVCGDEPRSRPFSPGASSGNVNPRPGSYSKDSDADSGISQPVAKSVTAETDPFYSTDEDLSSVIMSPSYRGTASKPPVGKSHHGPMHSTPNKPPSYQGVRPKTKLSQSEMNLVQQCSRTESHEKRREHVKFEDEVYGNRHLAQKHRTLSQPMLNGGLGGNQGYHENQGVPYDEVLAGYGSPPGLDFEQYSDITHTRGQNKKGILNNKSGLFSQNGAVYGDAPTRADKLVPPPRIKNWTMASSSPVYGTAVINTGSHASVIAPPRTKHKQRKAAATKPRANSIDHGGYVSNSSSNLQHVRSSSEVSLSSMNSELSMYSQNMDVDCDTNGGKKKSKLPWKKSKGRFTPSKEMEKMQHKMLGELSRSSSKASLTGSITSEAPPGEQINSYKTPPGESIQNYRKNSYDSQISVNNQNNSQRLSSGKPQIKNKSSEKSGSYRSPENKPPPAPKPQHLSSKPTQHQVQKTSEKIQDITHNNNTKSSKYQIEVEIATKPPKPKKPPVKQKPSSRQYEDIPRNESQSMEQKPAPNKPPGKSRPTSEEIRNEPGYASIEEIIPKPVKQKNPQVRKDYEDIDDGNDEIVPYAESPYEDVHINKRENIDEASSSENDGENFQEAAVDVEFDPAAQYASVDYSKKTQPAPVVQYINLDDDFREGRDSPPLPDRGYHESNLGSSKELSGSRSSLFNRMDSLKQSAKKKFSKLRKAISLEKLDKTGHESSSVPASPTIEHTGGFKRTSSMKSLTEAFGFVKKIRERRNSGSKQEPLSPDQRKPPRAPTGLKKASISSPEASVENPHNFRTIGNVRTVHKDGSQVVELTKPPHGPFGFYIARGNAKYNHAVLVSRLSDGLPEHFFAGLLSVGDEILEIDSRDVKHMALEEVYDLMATQDKLLLRIMPYAVRETS